MLTLAFNIQLVKASVTEEAATTTINMWEKYFKADVYEDCNTYIPTPEDFGEYVGLVADDSTLAPVHMIWYEWSIFGFRTWVYVSTPKDISIGMDGDDGYGLYLDGNFICGRGNAEDPMSYGTMVLSAGWHKIEALVFNGIGGGVMEFDKKISDYVDVMIAGHDGPVVLSPQNTTYTTSSVPLTFLTREPASWMGYSLDGQLNVTVTGNTILSGLSDGSHSLIVYANDTAENMSYSNIVYFTIDTIPPIVTINPVTSPTDIAVQTVTGTFTEANIDRIVVNGVNATLDKVAGTYSANIALVWGNNLINVTAFDLGGNTATATDTIVYSPPEVWYKDEDKNFEILVPPGWTYKSDVKFGTAIMDVVLYGPTEDGFRININIVSGSDPEVKETETYLVNGANEVINAFSSQFGDFQVIQSPICTTINGQAAVTYVVQYQTEGSTIKQKQAIIVSDERNYFWAITATALAKNYEKYEPTFDATIESFKALLAPPIWMQWWFLLIIVVIIVAIVGAVVLLRRRKLAPPPPQEIETEEKIEGAPSVEARKRPTGLTIIAILWLLGAYTTYT